MLSRPPSSPAMAMRSRRPRRREKVVGRHLAIVENDLAGRLHVPAHLVLVAPKERPGASSGHDEGGNAFRPVVAGAGHDDIEVAVAGAGDELLGAVEHIVAAARAPRASSAPRRRSRSRARSGNRRQHSIEAGGSAGRRRAARRCPKSSIIQAAMLWIEMKAEKAGQACGSASKTSTASSRASPEPPHCRGHRCRRSQGPGVADHVAGNGAGRCPSRARSARCARRRRPGPSRGSPLLVGEGEVHQSSLRSVEIDVAREGERSRSRSRSSKDGPFRRNSPRVIRGVSACRGPRHAFRSASRSRLRSGRRISGCGARRAGVRPSRHDRAARRAFSAPMLRSTSPIFFRAGSHSIVGIEKAAPSLMPEGQRAVTVLVRV